MNCVKCEKKLGKNNKSGYCQEHRNLNPVRIKYRRDYATNNRETNYEVVRDRALRLRYDLSLQEYNRMLSQQDSKCKICGKHESELKKVLVVDHCHVSNKIRGIICDRCNVGLGYFNDDVTVITEAATYLKTFLASSEGSKS